MEAAVTTASVSEAVSAAAENMPDTLSELWQYLSEHALSFLLSLIGAALVLVVGLKLSGWLVKLFINGKLFSKLDESVRSFIRSFIGISLKIVVCITAAAILGVPLTAFVTVLGSAGVAIGLALQGSLSNLAGGIMILIYKPFRVGDYIDTHTDSGTVTAITIFYTTLTTPDNRRISLPNGSVSNSSVVNYSSLPTRRLDMEFSAAYESDIDEVIGTILTVANAHPLAKSTPAAPFARLLRQDDSALVFVLRVWCDKGDYWTLKFDLGEQMKKAFDERGIDIPFQQITMNEKKS